MRSLLVHFSIHSEINANILILVHELGSHPTPADIACLSQVCLARPSMTCATSLLHEHSCPCRFWNSLMFQLLQLFNCYSIHHDVLDFFSCQLFPYSSMSTPSITTFFEFSLLQTFPKVAILTPPVTTFSTLSLLIWSAAHLLFVTLSFPHRRCISADRLAAMISCLSLSRWRILCSTQRLPHFVSQLGL